MTNKHYLLAELRCASLRAQLAQADIDAIAQALKFDIITPEQALVLLTDADVLGFTKLEKPASIEEAVGE
jgi:hypothetical protein